MKVILIQQHAYFQFTQTLQLCIVAYCYIFINVYTIFMFFKIFIAIKIFLQMQTALPLQKQIQKNYFQKVRKNSKSSTKCTNPLFNHNHNHNYMIYYTNIYYNNIRNSVVCCVWNNLWGLVPITNSLKITRKLCSIPHIFTSQYVKKKLFQNIFGYMVQPYIGTLISEIKYLSVCFTTYILMKIYMNK
eukprot:TRINITY_DN9498_c0_g1_i6.p1 TRINITY_DN9498_c0_g1~~TRINITY_DN9498_c0_g1_i6.p1  ORF type:complete len:188 (+),score=-24.52 TRINITY_DN9498_c0_g1_i6:414-977(+)